VNPKSVNGFAIGAGKSTGLIVTFTGDGFNGAGDGKFTFSAGKAGEFIGGKFINWSKTDVNKLPRLLHSVIFIGKNLVHIFATKGKIYTDIVTRCSGMPLIGRQRGGSMILFPEDI